MSNYKLYILYFFIFFYYLSNVKFISATESNKQYNVSVYSLNYDLSTSFMGAVRT